MDVDYIRSVGEERGFPNMTDDDVKRAHLFSIDGSREDYYYRLKEFFNGSMNIV